MHWYLLPKIHKRLFEVPEFLDSELQSGTQEGWLYIKDSGDFIKKLKTLIIFHRML